jgi:hypothetical protein
VSVLDRRADTRAKSHGRCGETSPLYRREMETSFPLAPEAYSAGEWYEGEQEQLLERPITLFDEHLLWALGS